MSDTTLFFRRGRTALVAAAATLPTTAVTHGVGVPVTPEGRHQDLQLRPPLLLVHGGEPVKDD